jgi:hypothetical protein
MPIKYLRNRVLQHVFAHHNLPDRWGRSRPSHCLRRSFPSCKSRRIPEMFCIRYRRLLMNDTRSTRIRLAARVFSCAPYDERADLPGEDRGTLLALAHDQAQRALPRPINAGRGRKDRDAPVRVFGVCSVLTNLKLSSGLWNGSERAFAVAEALTQWLSQR